MAKRWYATLIASLAVVTLLLVSACTPASLFRASESENPSVEIVEPSNHSTAGRADTIRIRALVDDPRGIASVQLTVNGVAVATETPPSPPVTQLTQDLYWTPQAVGQYEIKVDARDNDGNWGHSKPITLYVVEVFAQQTVIAAVLTPTPLFAVGASASPSPLCCPPTPTPVCHDKADFVADATVTDGTPFSKGVTFDKTWRLRNTGSCDWNTSYQLVFVGGSQLGATSPTALKASVPRGQPVDITVRMTAPNTPGSYHSKWQLRNPAGRNFGPVIYARIQVLPGTGDLPVITRFEVIPGSIQQGEAATLHWASINGTTARLFPGDQALALNGSQIVAPNTTTTYRLVVGNATGSVEHTTTLIVRPRRATQPPPSPANLSVIAFHANGFDFSWVDSSTDEQGFRLYNADNGQVVATFGPNASSGPVRGLACGTAYRFYLVSFNDAGESWPSNQISATTSPCG